MQGDCTHTQESLTHDRFKEILSDEMPEVPEVHAVLDSVIKAQDQEMLSIALASKNQGTRLRWPKGGQTFQFAQNPIHRRPFPIHQHPRPPLPAWVTPHGFFFCVFRVLVRLRRIS